MLKKFIVTSAILVSSTVAFANPAPYIGIGSGVSITTDNHSATQVTVNGIVYNINGGNYRGVPINFMAGFAGVIDECFYLGIEGFVTAGTVQWDDNSSFLKTSYGYGASILPGVILSDHTLAYARLGAVGTRFSEANATRAGGQIGLGMQTSLTQNIDLRGEYTFTAYRSVDKHVAGFDYFDNSPRTDAYTVSLIYRFE